MNSKPEKDETLQLNSSLTRAFDILEFLATYGAPQSAPEISRKLKINKVTTYNLLRTLEYRQYILKNTDGKYSLSSKVLELGTLFRSSHPAINVFRFCSLPLLNKYPACNISLGGFGTSMRGVYLKILGQNESFVSAGTAFPLHATAVGKVLLANSTPQFQKDFFAQATLTKYTSATVTDIENLKKQLAEIRDCGYCVLNGELFTNFHCIASPVFSAGRHLIGGVSIRGGEQFVKKNCRYLIEDIVALGKTISSNMGYNESPFLNTGDVKNKFPGAF